MRNFLFLVVSPLLAMTLAMGTGNGGENWNVGDQQATVTERAHLTIPQRVALHLTEDEWIVDLNNPALGADGEGCYLVPKGYPGTLEDAINDALEGNFESADTYPAIKDRNGNGKIDEGEKGTLICLNQKVLQKFCNNPDGCELDLKVTRISPKDEEGGSYGQGGVMDRAVDINHVKLVQFRFGHQDDATPLELLRVRYHRLPGWLDDIIIEAFWFDGSEVAGTYQFNFLFLLAAL